MFEIRHKLQILPDEGGITCYNHKQKRLQLSNSLHTAILDFITSPPYHYCQEAEVFCFKQQYTWQ